MEKCIIIIDDTKSGISEKEELLRSNGYKVLVLNDSRKAIEQILTKSPCLIIAENEMEQLDGFQIGRIIRYVLRHQQPPILLFSSHWNNKFGTFVTNRLGNVYLEAKPCSDERLLQLCEDILSKSPKVKTAEHLEDVDLTDLLIRYSKQLEEIYNQHLMVREIELLLKHTDNIHEFAGSIRELIDNFLVAKDFILLNRTGYHNLAFISNDRVSGKTAVGKLIKLVTHSRKYHIKYFTPDDAKVELQASDDYRLFKFSISRNGKFFFRLIFSYLSDPLSEFFLIILTERLKEYTEKLLLSQTIYNNSITDYLTTCYNNQFFYEELERINKNFEETGENFSLIMFDIDFFKRVNDTYGHQIGDDVLIKTSKIIKNNIRPYDKLYRIGGEEFIAILYGCNINDAMKTAERIRESVAKTKFDKIDWKVTISGGVIDKHSMPAHDIYKMLMEVDALLYKAKESGRNCIRMYQGKNGLQISNCS